MFMTMAEYDPNRQGSPPSEEDRRQASDEHRDESVVINGKKHKKRTVFYITAVIIGLVLLAAAVMEPLVGVLRYILSLLSPLIIGGIIAYLCDPILEFYEYRVYKRMRKGNLRRGLSLFCTVITAFGIVAAVFAMMLPQLIDSLTELFKNYEVYLNNLLAWIQVHLESLTENLHVEIVDISTLDKFMTFLDDMFGSVENAFSQVMETLAQFAEEGNLLEKTWAALIGLFNAFKNLFIGLFIAFYFLASKEKRVAQFRKFRKAMFDKKTDDRIEEILTLTDRTFGGFIYGKILDSLVIGILTFVLLLIFEVSPYNLLIATFVGITNIIPVFGPFIGAIPSFFIVLISNPNKAFIFLVIILIVQQLDGNIIGPKILGDNCGVSSLCVIIAIAICSTLWGVLGMIIGVPIFAVVIELIKRMLERRLEAKGEPTDTLDYYPANAVGNAEIDVYYEHSTLRYTYEHSKFKHRFRRWRRNLFSHLGRQAKPELKKAPKASDTEENTPKDPATIPADTDKES